MSYTIYLVEDEKNLNDILTTYLRGEGWEVSSFYTGEEAREAIDQPPHLWVLDIMLPDIDGFQLIKEIKAMDEHIPVIFISARDEDLDRIIGLEMGSDDYLPKPFLPRELVIRCKKILERTYQHALPQSETESALSIPPYDIYLTKRLAKENERTLELTSKEFDLLLLFVQNQNHAFSREQILYRVWGEDYFGSDRVVDDLVRRLRKKMPHLRIETIYGYGYRMVKP